VDDFAVKYVGKENAHHLRNALLHSYEITTDWGGTVYSGTTFTWDCHKRTCDIFMPGYVANVLNKFKHDNPRNPQHTPSKYVTPVYGAKSSTQPETRHRSSPQSSALTSKRSQDQFYTVQGQYIPPYLCPSMPLLWNKLKPQKRHKLRQISSWTTWSHILTP
jgi:hypothetical protein